MYILKNEFIWIVAILIGLFVSSATPYSDQSIVSPLERFNWTWVEPVLDEISFDYAGETISRDTLGTVPLIEFFIRKATHVVVFLVLGALLVKAIARLRLHASLTLLFAWTMATTVAAFDEFHQSLTPERTPLIQDVILDSMGALLGVLLIGGIYLMRRKRSGRKRNGYVALR